MGRFVGLGGNGGLRRLIAVSFVGLVSGAVEAGGSDLDWLACSLLSESWDILKSASLVPSHTRPAYHVEQLEWCIFVILAIPRGNFRPRWLPSNRPGICCWTIIYYRDTWSRGLKGRESRVEVEKCRWAQSQIPEVVTSQKWASSFSLSLSRRLLRPEL
jgi:hypothetical protein